MRRVRKIQVHSEMIVNNFDKSESFVLKKCSVYLQRYFNKFLSMDNETLEILCWCLGPDMVQVGEILLAQFNIDERKEFNKTLYEYRYNLEDYASELKDILRKTKRSFMNRFMREIQKLLKKRVQSIEYNGNSDIEKNIMAAKRMFKLTEQESDFCTFFFILNTFEMPEDFFDSHLECNKYSGRKYLLTLLGLSQKELEKILKGTLSKIGLLEQDRYNLCLDDDFLTLLQNPSVNNFTENFFKKLSPNNLPLESYFLDKEETQHILNLLKEKRKTPTNLLFYGPPGTGKTSFAQGIAKQLGIPSYEIIKGDENTTKNRRAAILACLNMTNNDQGSLIIVDEADNLLNTRFSWFMRGETQDKGWLNQLLEQSGTRMIWITNNIEAIEESVLRRFAYSHYFKSFNRKQRICLWDSILRKNKVKRLVSHNNIEGLAKRYKVSAGAINTAIEKAAETSSKSKKGFYNIVTLTLDSHETLLNGGDKPKRKDTLEKNYSLEGLNIQGDLNSMIEQLENFDQYLQNSNLNQKINMNLLFYGPPGTGKTELGHYLSDHLDKEIISKRASDILDPYVGMTERNIMKAFEEAEDEEAILMIDEIESMLFTRDRAQRSWEISFTNEFLTQMERFKGILICTSNRLEDIDNASIRRFSYKIGFDYLKPEGNIIFYQQFLLPLINTPLNESKIEVLRTFANLTPGDFKVVRDKYSFHKADELNHRVLLDALREESQIKKYHLREKHIGF